MIVALSVAEIDSFRALVAERLGLHFDDGKLDLLAEVLRERMEKTGCREFCEYRDRMSSAKSEKGEIEVLAEHLTVNETYFFRYAEHFEAFAELALPGRIHARCRQRKLRILSAGCASGEEPYSLAMLIRERFPQLAHWDMQIIGFDINPAVLQKAVRARYSSWSLRETPADLRAKYFRPHGRDFLLDSGIRAAVVFEQRNLVEHDSVFWDRDAFDAIFCRNVTMYLTSEVMRSVVSRIAQSIAAGGFLFLGHAETLRGVSQDFHLRHSHQTFYYQRRERLENGSTLTGAASTAAFPVPPGTPPDPPYIRDSWFTSIHRASERISDLARSNASVGRRTNSNLPPLLNKPLSKTWDRTTAIDLLRREKFSEAMALVRSFPAESQADPDTQLLFAVLLTNRGELQEAENVCRQILRGDELNAGAHYLMALCREHAGDQDGAAQHDQTATYLDSEFAMPHLHLGLVAKKSSDFALARRELAHALPLLAREDPSRILFFGGGFTRDALVELCRSELRACGGAS